MELPVPNCSMQHQNPVGDFDDTGHFLQGASCTIAAHADACCMLMHVDACCMLMHAA
jgi:hypothetical protein